MEACHRGKRISALQKLVLVHQRDYVLAGFSLRPAGQKICCLGFGFVLFHKSKQQLLGKIDGEAISPRKPLEGDNLSRMRQVRTGSKGTWRNPEPRLSYWRLLQNLPEAPRQLALPAPARCPHWLSTSSTQRQQQAQSPRSFLKLRSVVATEQASIHVTLARHMIAYCCSLSGIFSREVLASFRVECLNVHKARA